MCTQELLEILALEIQEHHAPATGIRPEAASQLRDPRLLSIEVRDGPRLERSEGLVHLLKEVLKEGKSVTYDLKQDRNDPTAVGTKQMAEAICQKLR